MNESRELVIPARAEVINMEDYAMPSERVLGQVKLIQDVMKSVMRVDEHFGVIPGAKKPSLYKPGAEKLSMTFRLAPTYPSVERRDLHGGHREVIVLCRLTHIPTGNVVGEGLGSCSTLESKYRYRTGPVEPTGKPVPAGYWDLRKADPAKAQELLGGRGFQAKKVDGRWEIVRAGDRVENPDPADVYNTVLKMAKKRAHVDAVLTATAASDIFTQDVEDMGGEDQHHETKEESQKPMTPPSPAPPSQTQLHAQPQPAGPLPCPPCPKCGGACWDNRPKKSSGAMNAKAPDAKCKEKSCDGVVWKITAKEATAQPHESQNMPEYLPDDSREYDFDPNDNLPPDM